MNVWHPWCLACELQLVIPIVYSVLQCVYPINTTSLNHYIPVIHSVGHYPNIYLVLYMVHILSVDSGPLALSQYTCSAHHPQYPIITLTFTTLTPSPLPYQSHHPHHHLTPPPHTIAYPINILSQSHFPILLQFIYHIHAITSRR